VSNKKRKISREPLIQKPNSKRKKFNQTQDKEIYDKKNTTQNENLSTLNLRSGKLIPNCNLDIGKTLVSDSGVKGIM
jgi:hypothetical protein